MPWIYTSRACHIAKYPRYVRIARFKEFLRAEDRAPKFGSR